MNGAPLPPRRWLEATLRDLVLGAPENVLPDRGGQAIFGPPLVGVADGDDPLFVEFRRVVGPRHLMPRELLGSAGAVAASPARVVVWALPYTEPVRRSNRGDEWPSSLYSQARNNAAALNEQIARSLVEAIAGRGRIAVAPAATPAYDAFRDDRWVFSSSWSERHAAYAAGLGAFGLNGGLITRAGIAVRFGSIVTDLDLEPSPRPEAGHRHSCLGPDGAACGRCIGRCPAGAIGPAGLDKQKCYVRRNLVRERFLPTYRRELALLEAAVVKGGTRARGHSLGCALCQCGVPCEAADPRPAARRGGRGA